MRPEKWDNKTIKIVETKNSSKEYVDQQKEKQAKSKKEPFMKDINIDSHLDEVLLEVKDLTKQYNKKAKPAIDHISFKVYRGEFHAFIGANGAGKTTTIKSIVGAYANFDGNVYISGVSNKDKDSKAKLGYIPEIARFPARISTYDYLISMALLNRLDKEHAVKFVEDILKKFSMENLKHVSPNNFSSGQKKKILLAQALSNNPDLLIMDEPAANLDPKSRIEFFDILKDLEHSGKSIFISSHILSELDIYANAVTILDGGKIVYTGKRTNEVHGGNKYAYRILLKKEDDFGNINLKKFYMTQDKEEKRQWIISSNDKNAIDKLLGELFSKQKLEKIEVYNLTIEDMYKKYVIKGSVHTGYRKEN